MELKNIKAAAVVVRTIRDEWNPRTIEAQLTEMADNWPHADVLYAAVIIASDMSNQFPATLSMKAGKVLEKLHTKTATIRTKTGGTGDGKGYLCDVCTKPERDCQTAATNMNGCDHAFVNVARRNLDRDQMHADGRIAAARAVLIGEAAKSMFKMPADVANIHIPTDPQEKSA